MRVHAYEVHGVKFIEAGSRMAVMGGGAEKGKMGSYCLVGTEFLLGKMRKTWRWMAVMVAQ